MATKSNKIRQNDEKPKLADRQLKAIPLIVTSTTYTEGCKKARLNRTTFYEWLKNREFKAELDKQRDEVAAKAFGLLSQSLTKAIETLVGLLDTRDDRLKRLAAKDVVEYVLKHKELKDLEKRIEAIEESLQSRQ